MPFLKKNNLFFILHVLSLECRLCIKTPKSEINISIHQVNQREKDPNFYSTTTSSLKTFSVFIWVCPSVLDMSQCPCIGHTWQSVKFEVYDLFISMLWTCTLWPHFLWGQVDKLVPSLAQGLCSKCLSQHKRYENGETVLLVFKLPHQSWRQSFYSVQTTKEKNMFISFH